jgi:D-erythro-7,8-dihydroneopterin triphosphate epimerase
VEDGQFMLLEKLASEVLELVMENELVCQAKVEVDKPHALRFADSVSVSMSASR